MGKRGVGDLEHTRVCSHGDASGLPASQGLRVTSKRKSGETLRYRAANLASIVAWAQLQTESLVVEFGDYALACFTAQSVKSFPLSTFFFHRMAEEVLKR